MSRALKGLLALTCWILGATMTTTTVMAAEVEGMRSYRAPDHTRMVFDLSEPAEHTVFTLDNPRRIVIDIKNTRLNGSLDDLDLGETPVNSVRSAARNGTDLRVVFDMSDEVQPRSFSLTANEQYGNRLVIDLYDKNTESAQASSVTDNTPANPRTVITADELDNSRDDIVVAISAGHGGEDPGAVGVNGLQEKRVVLAIAEEMKAILDRTPGYRAVMVRESDYYVDLRQRTRLAHEHDADFFVAIHADAYNGSNARGATVYALSQSGATSEHARRLAEKENSADLIGGVGSVSLSDKDEMLASVLLDLSMTASISSSLEAGEKIIASMGNVTRMRRTNVEQAAFVVLKSPDIPSLLIETGYITNSHDAANLGSSAHRKKLAGAIVNGITSYFWETPPRGTFISWQKQNGGAPQQYTVVSGDSLSIIAQRFNVSLQTIRDTNQLNSDTIRVGQIIRIPSI